MKFVWILRTWNSQDTFWEHVREHKEYEKAYLKVEVLLEEIKRIILQKQQEWKDLCSENNELKEVDKDFAFEIPTAELLKTRPFFKFLSIVGASDSKKDLMQTWYVERLHLTES